MTVDLTELDVPLLINDNKLFVHILSFLNNNKVF